MIRWFLLPLALGLLWWFAATLRRTIAASRSLTAGRAGWLDEVAPLLQDPSRILDPSGFPRLTGTYAGQRFELRAIPDSLTFRKLPALWLLVTLTEPQKSLGEARIMARASGQETFSTFADLPLGIALPPGFPPHCTLRADSPAALPPPAVMQDLARGFSDPAWKEAVVSPNGLRLVRLAEEAERGPYLIYRDASLGRSACAPAMARAMLDRLITLSETLNA